MGIDFGLKTFLTLSDNKIVTSPQYYLKYQKELKRVQRRVSKKKKNSDNYKKAKRKLTKLHIKFVAIEDLNIKAMQKIWGRKVTDLVF